MKNYKKEYKKLKKEHKLQSEILKAWVWELCFSNMQNDYLWSVLDEVEVMTNDPLTKAVIKNAKERHHLDKLIHARKLFE